LLFFSHFTCSEYISLLRAIDLNRYFILCHIPFINNLYSIHAIFHWILELFLEYCIFFSSFYSLLCYIVLSDKIVILLLVSGCLIYSSIHKKSILNYYDFSIGFWNYSVSVIFFVFTFYSFGCSDYCQSNFIQFAPIFVVSTKCIDPWVLEFVVSNIIGDHQMGKLYFV